VRRTLFDQNKLLAAAEQAGFAVMLTCDQT
jgi:hypothetical protein